MLNKFLIGLGHGVGFDVPHVFSSLNTLPMPVIEAVGFGAGFLWLYLFFAPWRDDDES